MEWIEVTGRTLEEAVERALDNLGVHETELDYEVLTEPKTGLLGLRRTDARIRARVKPRSREKPNDKRRRQRDDQRSRRRGGRERGAGGEAGQPARRGPGSQAAGNGRNRTSGAPAAAAGGDTPESSGGTRSRRRRGRGGGQRGATEAGTARGNGNGTLRHAGRDAQDVEAQGVEAQDVEAQDVEVPASGARQEEHEVMERSGSIEEQVSAGREFATGLVEAFAVQGSVSVEVDDHEVEVRIDGDDLGLLVGPKGATLAALEELLRGAVGHRGPGRLHLDVAGYRAKRRAALADFARRVADDVRSSGAAKALEPMSAPDRKVVHDTIGEISGVATISDGEEPRRRVIIQPA